MAQPRGQKRIPGHRKTGHAGCECGWTPWHSLSASRALVARGRHLVDVRMDLAK